MVRALHDVKATDMGNNNIRFKAEVDFDGRELTRTYLDKRDLEEMLVEMQMMNSLEDADRAVRARGPEGHLPPRTIPIRPCSVKK